MAFPTGKTMSGVKSATGGSNYAYRTGVQPNGTPSIGNWNTGGSVAGYGNSKGVYDQMGRRIGGSGPAEDQWWNDPVQSGPIRPALGAQGLPNVQLPMPQQVPMGFSLPSFLTNAAQYKNPFMWPTTRRAIMDAVNAAHARMGSWLNQEYNPLSSVRVPSGKQIIGKHPYVGRDMFAGQYRSPQQGGGYPVSGPNVNQVAIKTGGVTKFQDRVPSDQYKGFNNPW